MCAKLARCSALTSEIKRSGRRRDAAETAVEIVVVTAADIEGATWSILGQEGKRQVLTHFWFYQN